MKILKQKPSTPGEWKVRLRIDHRTVITIKSKEALRMWKEKYPNAEEVVM
jgi:hypothetical protein